ncbi:hypothetical protein B0H63DRAFT_518535 [Podospora didyma]|uniref:Uncharacterized protein n=1 Tax=Podospora didyma TaxID=330526 RepID=A0AAE0NX69_9PEZI|nr:hypothetical protein B0H63DRAFT_518535 [Podospora didyma]
MEATPLPPPDPALAANSSLIDSLQFTSSHATSTDRISSLPSLETTTIPTLPVISSVYRAGPVLSPASSSSTTSGNTSVPSPSTGPTSSSDLNPRSTSLNTDTRSTSSQGPSIQLLPSTSHSPNTPSATITTTPAGTLPSNGPGTLATADPIPDGGSNYWVTGVVSARRRKRRRGTVLLDSSPESIVNYVRAQLHSESLPGGRTPTYYEAEASAAAAPRRREMEAIEVRVELASPPTYHPYSEMDADYRGGSETDGRRHD